MSFHDYFFAAPGADVEREFVGFDNFVAVATDPAVWRSFLNVGIFLIINVPLTVVLSLLLATALNRVVRGAPVPAGQLLRAVRDGIRRGRRGLAVHVQRQRARQPGPRPARPGSLVADQPLSSPCRRSRFFVTWKQLGFFILLYLAALQAVPQELYESAATDGAGAVRTFFSVTVPGVRSATLLVLLLATITGANLFTEPYLLTNGGGPNGASTSPVLLMYQKGLEQGNPDVAAAIGVILVILVLILALIERKLVGDEES